eukprot:4187287-Prymnesium_polylepis.1
MQHTKRQKWTFGGQKIVSVDSDIWAASGLHFTAWSAQAGVNARDQARALRAERGQNALGQLVANSLLAHLEVRERGVDVAQGFVLFENGARHSLRDARYAYEAAESGVGHVVGVSRPRSFAPAGARALFRERRCEPGFREFPG